MLEDEVVEADDSPQRGALWLGILCLRMKIRTRVGAPRVACNFHLRLQALSASVTLSPLVGLPDAAFADKRLVGEVSTSGLLFKDVKIRLISKYDAIDPTCYSTLSTQTLKIEAFDDPKVTGVQLYLSDFERPVTEKLVRGDVFSDPAQGGLTCSRSPGDVVVAASASLDKSGEEVLSESRSLLFKSLKVCPTQPVTFIFAVFRDVHPSSSTVRNFMDRCVVSSTNLETRLFMRSTLNGLIRTTIRTSRDSKATYAPCMWTSLRKNNISEVCIACSGTL